VKRQGRTWRITTVETDKENPYMRLMLRLSEGIVLPKKKVKQTFTPLKAGQHPSEFKANKYISCKILNYQTKEGIQMIPVPIVSKERIITSIGIVVALVLMFLLKIFVSPCFFDVFVIRSCEKRLYRTKKVLCRCYIIGITLKNRNNVAADRYSQLPMHALQSERGNL
jgi:hypothetical protein